MRPGKALKLGLLPTLCCLVAMLLVGCGSSSFPGSGSRLGESKAPVDQQVFRYGMLATDISTFDPGQATDQPSLEAITMAFTGLVQMDDNLQAKPQMAQSYAISPDGLDYTFHLRPNLKFSDGTPLNANDVAYSIDRALSPAVSNINGATGTYLGQIKGATDRMNGKIPTLLGIGVKVLDATTIELLTTTKTAYFLQALTYPTSYVVEKSVIDRWGDKWTDHLGDNGGQGGAGPFKVQSYNHNTGITFVPNPNYYGAQPQLQKAAFEFYKTPETAFQAYQANQVDFVKSVPPVQVESARTLPNDQYSQNVQLAIDYVAMNYLYKPFGNIHIRQAFALAINKDILAAAIYKNVRTSTCHIIPAGMPGYNSDLKCPEGAPTSGNFTRAKALFEQGLQEERLTLNTFPPIKITYRTGRPDLDKLVSALIQQWQQVLGVNVTSQTMDFTVLLKAESATTCAQADPARCQNQGLQMWISGWLADYPDPQDWITLQFGRGASYNEWNFGQNLSTSAPVQRQSQQQMAQADSEQDLANRLSMYNQIEQQLVNDVAWLPLDQRNSSCVSKPWVVGQVFNAQDLVPPDDWGSIYIGSH